ncbi:Superoxide dismutase [Mn/Fe] [endosymbiont DhMRE of Dentiscutata heterogama]|uniref:superoxide dismutase n=1 Tax=endosymbiont DhMRE of Dentiscutata heterogama TaxID=1609546 RepID=UPI000629DBA4|nr:superoxide dismutase [endosymbiont DhMRE of Dentiscutata heterogama]CFW93054.1 Superoxide dismutase [Mn/Fe] [endosymbiont DhMRE of Dentiscutata heterogama]
MNNYQRIKLPYELNELEWVISFKTMYYHYNILHKNYEVKLLETLRGTEIMEQFPTLENLMENLAQLPEEIKDDVRFFGGGLINHNFFFAHLTKFKPEQKERERTEKISPDLLNLIQEKFGSLEKLKKELVKSALKVRGSGWTWLVLNKKGELKIINTTNQDGPWSLHLRPLIAIDVWEHAYYLDYGANRKEYVEKLLELLLNWEYISQSYQSYIS